ncbi:MULTISPECIES: response regulator transcription factor [Salinibaculum]|uniref:response regulator transcription factor n=1 Tax=Salinibaculum TaxID=2732368 RepID=UPI0030CDB9FE
MSHHSTAGEPRDGGDPEPTVLFVDDERDLLEVYEALYGDDYEVLTAAGGQEALRKFDDDVDFAFLDRRMPEMSGDELLDAIRDAGYETPVGMLSAVDAEVAAPPECAVYIAKPADRGEVRAAIERHT